MRQPLLGRRSRLDFGCAVAYKAHDGTSGYSIVGRWNLSGYVGVEQRGSWRSRQRDGMGSFGAMGDGGYGKTDSCSIRR